MFTELNDDDAALVEFVTLGAVVRPFRPTTKDWSKTECLSVPPG